MHLFYKTRMLGFRECVIEEPRLHRENHRPCMGYPTLFYAWPRCPINPMSAAVGYSHWAPLKETKKGKCVGCRTKACDLKLASALPNWANQMAVPPITTPEFFDAWINVCVCVCVFWWFFFSFWFGFYVPFKNISLISSRLFIKGGRKPEYPGKNHLTIRKQNTAFPHVARARLEPQLWEMMKI